MTNGIVWHKAEDIRKKTQSLVERGGFFWLDLNRIFFVRSYGTKTKALARIWGLPKIWQKVLGVEPHYVIEVVGERFDKLPESKKNDVLLHELAHIPRNFSGALVPHYRKGRSKFNDIIEGLRLRSFGR